MRQGNRVDNEQSKKLARIKYANRQIDKFIKWYITQKGYLKYKELVEVHDQYNIKVYG